MFSWIQVGYWFEKAYAKFSFANEKWESKPSVTKCCSYSSNRSYNVHVHEGRKHKNEQTNEAQQEYMINHLQNSHSQMSVSSENNNFARQLHENEVMRRNPLTNYESQNPALQPLALMDTSKHNNCIKT